LNAAADGEIAHHRHPARAARTDKIVENLVGDVFVENALVPEFDQVIFQALSSMHARRART
jgi:hypothetical protein